MKEESIVASVLIHGKAGQILIFEDQNGIAYLPGGSSELGGKNQRILQFESHWKKQA